MALLSIALKPQRVFFRWCFVHDHIHSNLFEPWYTSGFMEYFPIYIIHCSLSWIPKYITNIFSGERILLMAAWRWFSFYSDRSTHSKDHVSFVEGFKFPKWYTIVYKQKRDIKRSLEQHCCSKRISDTLRQRDIKKHLKFKHICFNFSKQKPSDSR